MAIEDRIRDAVRSDGRTQREIAAAAGLREQNLSRFMRGGERGISLKVLEQLASALGLTIEARPAKRRR